MALILLREQFIVRPTGGTGGLSPFVKISEFYDDVARAPYATQADSQVNTPRFELALNALISVYDYRPGKSRRVLYDGNGGYYTRNVAGTSGGAPTSLRVLAGLLPLYTSSPGVADACVDLTGTLGLPPYQVQLLGTGGPANGYNQSATSPTELYPARFYNLREGQYLAVVTDATGAAASQLLTITAGQGKGRAVLIYEQASSVLTSTFQWSYNALNVVYYLYSGKAPSTYTAPYGTLLDGYLTNGGATWRRVYSRGVVPADGAPVLDLVYFQDTSTAEESVLELHNLILFHPDTAQEQTGGVILEMEASHPPLSFVLTGTSAAGPVNQANATGVFDGLAAASLSALVTDRLGKTLTVPVELRVRYGKRWVLAYDDQYGTPLRMELWLRGYTGPVDELCMTGTPVEWSSDGLSGSTGGQGDIPPAIGTEVKLNFLVDTDLFEPIITSSYTDRFCRADIYYDNKLEFRGFVRPDSYDAPMLAGPQEISISATDGLAALKDTDMLGHVGQRLIGHRPVLYTLLHCLSRCDVALPLRIFTNRRELSMDTLGAPELLTTTNRTGYWGEGKNEPEDQRTVVDGLAQLLGGTLVQREGTWQIRSALEAAKPAPGRSYKPAGTLIGAVTMASPLAAVEPPSFNRLYWLNAEQYKNVRAGWKSLTGKTDTGYLKNAYVAGGVFSDRYAWLGYGTGGLRPVSGWRPIAGQAFPTALVQLGEKGSDYTTRWPRSLTGSTNDRRYLQGPALPLAPGGEAVPAALQFTGRLVPTEFYTDADGNQVASPTNAQKAILSYELVIGGRGAGVQQAEFALSANATSKDTVVTIPLKSLPSAAPGAELRVYSWFAADTHLLDNATTLLAPGLQVFKKDDVLRYDFGTGTYRLFIAKQDTLIGQAAAYFLTSAWPDYFAEITATNAGLGQFYLSAVGIQLTPQNATWEGEDNFRADGPAGNVRPKDELEVYHADPPRAAGLFSGNLYAFGKAAGLADGTVPTSWQRTADLAPAPLFENNVLDGLALRANPSRLVTGALRYRNRVPVRLLDALDTPFDGALAGRRFFVVAVAPWDMKAATAHVSLVEIGRGAGALNPLLLLPAGVRTANRVYQYLPGQYAPYVRTVHGGGVRVVHL